SSRSRHTRSTRDWTSDVCSSDLYVSRWRYLCMALAQSAVAPPAPIDGASRQSFARIPEIQRVPNLIQIQRDSFRWFLSEGLREQIGRASWREGACKGGGCARCED